MSMNVPLTIIIATPTLFVETFQVVILVSVTQASTVMESTAKVRKSFFSFIFTKNVKTYRVFNPKLSFLHLDVNECSTSTDNCDSNAVCTNTQGSFTCACNSGFKGNGITCSGKKASCPFYLHNIPKFTFYHNSNLCITFSDVDECTVGTDNCDSNAMCTNTHGSFACACNTGFSGDGLKCEGKNLFLIVIATKFVIYLKLHPSIIFSDVDECVSRTDNCDSNAFCTNKQGSFDCTCNTGLSGDGVTCEGK